MTRVEKITLITETLTLDDIGQQIRQETGNSVICTVESVSRSEWTAAQQSSLSPAYVVKVFFRDYSGEKVAELYGRRFKIYRTYQAGDKVELYLAERVGEINGIS